MTVMQSIIMWVTIFSVLMLFFWRRTYCKKTRNKLEKLMYQKMLINEEMSVKPTGFGAIVIPGTRWALAEKERIKALELKMTLVITNIDSSRFGLKLLLANSEDLKPLGSFDGVDKVEKKWREVNEKKQRTRSNTNHQ